MKYYFVERIGRITTEYAPKDWFINDTHPNMFTNKKDAISAAKKQIKAEIVLLKQRLKEMRCES